MAKINKDDLRVGVTFTSCKNCEIRVNYENRMAVYKIILDRYGKKMQSIVALEELSECQKEICKFLRDKGNIDHLAEEVADAAIMLEQITQMYGIMDKVLMYMDEKCQRTLDRLTQEKS